MESEWTGERMVPGSSDILTEVQHWQRYLYFRPWFEGRRVSDAACGVGYGTAYASLFASFATGVDICARTVEAAQNRYSEATFRCCDVCQADYADADIVLSFETIEHLADEQAFLGALSACKGTIVVSTPNRNLVSPGNKAEDRPRNRFHVREWTPAEFETAVRAAFPDRQVRMLVQMARWPARVQEGAVEDPLFALAVVGDLPIPSWPHLGLVIPTCDGGELPIEFILNASRYYPGQTSFVVVSESRDAASIEALAWLESEMGYAASVLRTLAVGGFCETVKIGLESLLDDKTIDYVGLCDERALPTLDTLAELALSLDELSRLGHRPGLIGAVSDGAPGMQAAAVGPFASDHELLLRVLNRQRANHSSVTQAHLLSGPIVLATRECAESPGAFDSGVFDAPSAISHMSRRCIGAEFTQWVANGAFAHFRGSRPGVEQRAEGSQAPAAA